MNIKSCIYHLVLQCAGVLFLHTQGNVDAIFLNQKFNSYRLIIHANMQVTILYDGNLQLGTAWRYSKQTP